MRGREHCNHKTFLLLAFILSVAFLRSFAFITAYLIDKPVVTGWLWVLWQVPRINSGIKLCLRKIRRAIVKEISLLIAEAMYEVVQGTIRQSSGYGSGLILGN